MVAFQAVDPGSTPGRRTCVLHWFTTPYTLSSVYPVLVQCTAFRVWTWQKQVPTPGIEPGPPAWKAGILTTRPYGTWPNQLFNVLFQIPTYIHYSNLFTTATKFDPYTQLCKADSNIKQRHSSRCTSKRFDSDGELAQMVERSLSMREVQGSMPGFSNCTFPHPIAAIQPFHLPLQQNNALELSKEVLLQTFHWTSTLLFQLYIVWPSFLRSFYLKFTILLPTDTFSQ